MYFQNGFDIVVQVQNVNLVGLRKNVSLIFYLKNIVLNEPLYLHTPISKEHIV